MAGPDNSRLESMGENGLVSSTLESECWVDDNGGDGRDISRCDVSGSTQGPGL